MKFMFFLFVCLFFLLLLIFIVYFLSLYTDSSNFSKSSPFECGFQSFSGSGISFSMPFFVVSLMFLLFDVEILLVCFYPIFFSFFSSFYFMYFILFLILFSTVYEWAKGLLSWV